MERFKWPVPSDSYLENLISQDEAGALQYRVERLKFLWEEFGPPADMLLVGGFPAMFAFDELKRSSDIPQMTSKTVEIVPPFHHQGNGIPSAAIRWQMFSMLTKSREGLQVSENL